MSRVEDELFDEGDSLLQRRAEVEAAIGRFPGSRAALLIRVAQIERERERLRVELQRLVHEVDDVDPDEVDRDEAEEAEPSGFYAARERLVVRDRELVGRAEALQRRAAQQPGPTPAKLVELEREREQIEVKLRQWRGRCRQAGLRLDLPRWGEFAGAAEDD